MLDDEDDDAQDKWEFQSIWNLRIHSLVSRMYRSLLLPSESHMKEMKMYKHILFSEVWKFPVWIGKDTQYVPLQCTCHANRGESHTNMKAPLLTSFSASPPRAIPDPPQVTRVLCYTRALWTGREHPFLLSGSSLAFTLAFPSCSSLCHDAPQEPVGTFVPGYTVVSPQNMTWTILHHCDVYG